jgi:hypothetical protein
MALESEVEKAEGVEEDIASGEFQGQADDVKKYHY